jgi:hypothetical protein
MSSWSLSLPVVGYVDEEPLPPRPSFRSASAVASAAAAPAEASVPDHAWAQWLGHAPARVRARRWPPLTIAAPALVIVLAIASYAFVVTRPSSVLTPYATAGVQVSLGQAPAPIPAIVEETPTTTTPTASAPLSQRLLEPVPALLADGANAPGALPDGFSYSYADDWHGWPVAPVDEQHPVRGSFLAPREVSSGYHFGIDVSVDDAHPDPDVPPDLQGIVTHKVFALESGTISLSPDGLGFYGSSCTDRHFASGHFDYWHIYPTVTLGQYVQAGDQIGWTCAGDWHLHVSEWQYVGGLRTWVDPLHRGGKIAPYVDDSAPLISKLSFYGPAPDFWCPLKSLGESDGAKAQSQWHLRGLVEIRAMASDQQSFQGFLDRDPRYSDGFTPYRVAVAIWKGKKPVVAVNSFRGDTIPRTSYLVHYAPGSHKPMKMAQCVAADASGLWCGGSFVYRPLSTYRERYLDTRSLKDGSYIATVYVWDTRGNVTQSSQRIAIENGPSSHPRPQARLVTLGTSPCGPPLNGIAGGSE